MIVDRRLFRDSSHYALALASEILAPALRLFARSVARAGPVSPQQWRKGVILGSGHIGDVLYRTCSLDLLNRALPHCQWSYLTTPIGAAVLEGNPSVSEVLPWSRDTNTQAPEPHRYATLAERQFDVALCSDNVAHHRALLLALKLGIPNRVAFTRKGLSGLVTHKVNLTTPMSHSAAFRCMVEQITGTQDSSPLRPRIFPSTGDERAAEAESIRLRADDAELVIACAVTTRQTSAEYPPEIFVDILRRTLALAPHARIILTGLASDRPLLDSMAQELGERAAVSAGTLKVLAHGALLRRCDVFIGTDSGSRHLANAVRTPVFFVRNMGSTAVETGAYCPTEFDIAPVGEYLSPMAMKRALEEIDREKVASALAAAARGQAHDKSEGMPR